MGGVGDFLMDPAAAILGPILPDSVGVVPLPDQFGGLVTGDFGDNAQGPLADKGDAEASQENVLALQIQQAIRQQQQQEQIFDLASGLSSQLGSNQGLRQSQNASRVAQNQRNLANIANNQGVGRQIQGQGLIAQAQSAINGLAPVRSAAERQGQLSGASLSQLNQAAPQSANLGQFANQLAATSGQFAPNTSGQLQGLSGLAQGEFRRGATDISPQIQALQNNAAAIAQSGQQSSQDLAGLRSQGLTALNQTLAGQTPSSVSALFDQGPQSRDVLERQFNRAQQGITESTGQRGGALSRELAGLETARASAIAQDASQRERARQQFQQGLFATGLNQGLAAPGQEQTALGLSSNILQGAGQQQLGAEGLRQSALGQATGAQQAAGSQLLQGAGLQQGAQGQALQGLQAALQGQLGVGSQNLAALGQQFNQGQSNINQQARLQNQAFNQRSGLGQNLQTSGDDLQFRVNPALQNQSLIAGQVGIEGLLSALAPFTGQQSNTAGALAGAAGTAGQLAGTQQARQQALGQGIGTLGGAFFGGPVGAAAGGTAGGAVGGKK